MRNKMHIFEKNGEMENIYWRVRGNRMETKQHLEATLKSIWMLLLVQSVAT